MNTGPLYPLLKNCTKKVVVCQGGGDAGKTVTILQILAHAAMSDPEQIVTVEGEDIPNLRAGALRTFQRYVAVDPDVKKQIKEYNKTDRIYTFKNGSIIEFKSFADEQDARGSERDYLYMNEANTRHYMMFWQLERKTRKRVFIDYNPTMRFWAHEKLLTKATMDTKFTDRVQLYITDHRHNPYLSQEDHDGYENISDPEMFRVYARGQTGKVEGIIYRFKELDSVPRGTDGKELPFGFGVDIGYNTDPCVIVKVYYEGRNRYWQELLYMTENEILEDIAKNNLGITPQQYMARILKNNGCTPSTLVFGDHDKNYAFNLRRERIPYRMAKKGPNSVTIGISKVKSFNNFFINSPNLKKELETYVWEKAVDILTGKEITTNQPVAGYPDHCLDAGRYIITGLAMRHRDPDNSNAPPPEEDDEE